MGYLRAILVVEAPGVEAEEALLRDLDEHVALAARDDRPAPLLACDVHLDEDL
jgi:hypothetical protein